MIKHDVDVNDNIQGPYVYGKMNLSTTSISFSERTATLETNATVTFKYTQELALNEIVTITLPNYNTDNVELYSIQAAISQLMEIVQLSI